MGEDGSATTGVRARGGGWRELRARLVQSRTVTARPGHGGDAPHLLRVLATRSAQPHPFRCCAENRSPRPDHDLRLRTPPFANAVEARFWRRPVLRGSAPTGSCTRAAGRTSWSTRPLSGEYVADPTSGENVRRRTRALSRLPEFDFTVPRPLTPVIRTPLHGRRMA
ncbi:hypothetical protein QJS66_00455 [Kocuria rhizophila]|nr:hypothetical protein QJS66_00455 [Kocuria rhizophila]